MDSHPENTVVRASVGSRVDLNRPATRFSHSHLGLESCQRRPTVCRSELGSWRMRHPPFRESVIFRLGITLIRRSIPDTASPFFRQTLTVYLPKEKSRLKWCLFASFPVATAREIICGAGLQIGGVSSDTGTHGSRCGSRDYILLFSSI